MLKSFQKTLGQLRNSDRAMLLFIARKMAASEVKRQSPNHGRPMWPGVTDDLDLDSRLLISKILLIFSLSRS